MAKTTLNDLNDYLFDALDKITNDDLAGEALENEILRAEAIVNISQVIIQNGQLSLKVMEHMQAYGRGDQIKCTLLEEN